MSKFKISAPGRIVLSGEYAAMYGKCVVVASLDRRTTLNFVELIDDPNIIKIDFPDVDLSLNVSLTTVQGFISSNVTEDIILTHISLLRHVKSFITLHSMWRTCKQRYSLQIFFFLLYYIAYNEQLDIKSFHVHVSTELPIGAGLGSSASFAVCLAACFLHWARLQIGAHYAFNEDELISILDLAIYCEQVMQDYDFAIDNKVCSHGQIIRFHLVNPECFGVWDLEVPRMNILLIDSNIRQNRDERAQQMTELKHSFPEFDLILNSFDEISHEMSTTLDEINYNHRNHNLLHRQQNCYAQLQIYIQHSQRLLYNLGLSHPRFDTIVSIARDFEFAGKLTGFGGGFAYILLPPSVSEEQITNLSTRFREEGFDITRTSVSCNGVRIDASLH